MIERYSKKCRKCSKFQVCASVLKNDVYIRETLLGEKNPECKFFEEELRCSTCRFSEQDRPQDPMVCRKWSTKRGTAYTSPDGYCHKGVPREKEG